MPYTKTLWKDGKAGGTLTTAARLNNMETGIALAVTKAEALEQSGVGGSGAALPSGGTTGQVLTATSSGATVWAAPPAPTITQLQSAGAVTSAKKNGSTIQVVGGVLDLGTVGTSNLTVGTTTGTAKPGEWKPVAADVSDSTATGRSVLTAADAASARAVLGAGTSSLSLGTTSSTAKPGNYTPTPAELRTAGALIPTGSPAAGQVPTAQPDGTVTWAAPPAATSSTSTGVTASTDANGDVVLTSTDPGAVTTDADGNIVIA